MSDRSQPLSFMKMHGLGNDFVVVDGRAGQVELSSELVRRLGDRNRGVGFDQLALIENAAGADATLRFWNSDGTGSAACGNATRCIARWLMEQTGTDSVTLATERGLLAALDAGNGLTSVNMGQPQLRWDEIPLARQMDTLELPIAGAPVATGMGNPHCTFFVDDCERVDLADFGAAHEHDPLFPQRTNVQVAHLLGPDHIRMRVWERGAGITLASGSSSCAVAVAAVRRGLTGRKVRLELDGGQLDVDWRDDGVWMTGATTLVFKGELAADYLESLT